MPAAEDYYREAISLPMYADLSDAAQDEVVAALRESL
jgi:dTDP-4-amino-4,6-dideoxygalactose transaminase